MINYTIMTNHPIKYESYRTNVLRGDAFTNQKNIYALIKKEYSAKRIDYTL